MVFDLAEWSGFLSGLKLCVHCRDSFKVFLTSDVGVAIHWVGDKLVFDVIYLCSDGCFIHPYVLYCEVYSVG